MNSMILQCTSIKIPSQGKAHPRKENPLQGFTKRQAPCRDFCVHYACKTYGALRRGIHRMRYRMFPSRLGFRIQQSPELMHSPSILDVPAPDVASASPSFEIRICMEFSKRKAFQLHTYILRSTAHAAEARILAPVASRRPLWGIVHT